MKLLSSLFILLSFHAWSQSNDTLNGFQQKIEGEEIIYYSPLHEFANKALLTRTNGNMPVEWKAPVYKGKATAVTYELLIGHSTGTSTGDRNFDVSLNNQKVFTIITPKKKGEPYSLTGTGYLNTSFHFIQEDFDVNGDAFGYLYLTIPSDLVTTRADFKIMGQDMQSRDWLMVFMYQGGLKINAQATNLILRKENLRQLNLFIDNPYPNNTELTIITEVKGIHNVQVKLKHGYNKLAIPLYDPNKTGLDTILFVLNNNYAVQKIVVLKPIKNFEFDLIHHSHNDIGYSHIQTEVEQIQNKNILDAIHWISANKDQPIKPYWHIESLWAVENFLKIADSNQIKLFVDYVHQGYLVLSANYANILTGLSQPEELNWAIEYAKILEKKYGFNIDNVMTTDIPGLSRSAFMSYVNNKIPYLSFGPNYVSSQADGGDRIGSLLNEQGDKIFYWKPAKEDKRKLLVWTAGKGYSYFHGITDKDKEQVWQQRISDYCEELVNTNYPYEVIQLRYTKKSDNGPVDTALCSFVKQWNQTYRVPSLKITSVNELFKNFETKYGNQIPVCTGEISPYWEDGAYSSAVEEMLNRELAIKTIALEKQAKATNRYEANKNLFYQLHRNIILFHEHTWGSWCSISDPELPFTTDQWKIKKAFVDSANSIYLRLASTLAFKYVPEKTKNLVKSQISDFTVDPKHGGLNSIIVNQSNIVSNTDNFNFFEPIYSSGINPMKFSVSNQVKIESNINTDKMKLVKVIATLPTMKEIHITYRLDKRTGFLNCHISFDKEEEKNKESFHIAMPFNMNNPTITYGSNDHFLQFNKDQLPGSNRDFICVEKYVNLSTAAYKIQISSPKIALYELGDIIDENRSNGAKIWRKENNNPHSLFLYVFNNYWHTNYKAYQDGHFDFEVDLSVTH